MRRRSRPQYFRLANPRGTTALILGLKIEGAKEWFTVRMVAPARFGMDRPPRTFDEFREIAEEVEHTISFATGRRT